MPLHPNRFRKQKIFNLIPIEVCVDLLIYEIISKIASWLGICVWFLYMNVVVGEVNVAIK